MSGQLPSRDEFIAKANEIADFARDLPFIEGPEVDAILDAEVAKQVALYDLVTRGLKADEQLRDLKERLERAAATLDGMYRNALHPSDPGMARLAGKAEGVRLALSYLAEYERGVR